MGTIEIILARKPFAWEKINPIIGMGQNTTVRTILTGKKQVMVEVEDISNEVVHAAIDAFDQGLIDFMEYRSAGTQSKTTTRLVRIHGNWMRTWL